jgi:predicted nucleotidyltransferase
LDSAANLYNNGLRSMPVVAMDSIHALIERIVQAYHPERIVLFGSYAYGTPTVHSDVDLLVVLPFEGKWSRKAVEILNTLEPEFSVDLLVRTPEQVRQRLALNDFFLREVIERGKILYEATHP